MERAHYVAEEICLNIYFTVWDTGDGFNWKISGLTFSLHPAGYRGFSRFARPHDPLNDRRKRFFFFNFSPLFLL